MSQKTMLYVLLGGIMLMILYLTFKPGKQYHETPFVHESEAVKLAEPLLGFMVTRQGLDFQVTSGGCTEKADFRVDLLESYPIQLQLIRIKEDWCKALLPEGKTISFTYEELGLSERDAFSVVNPLGVMIVPMNLNDYEENK